ncbi:hypothetical protein EYF80_052429 [Liparis tanakae]|uniref:Uncharacterized protein n=1 Tax=Liparis tanakae TaxID=230148 RepID=A0A4Z2F8W7_9TELE|nr:hypothetical protein EYF80_052429 [Liparis tanakae]
MNFSMFSSFNTFSINSVCSSVQKCVVALVFSSALSERELVTSLLLQLLKRLSFLADPEFLQFLFNGFGLWVLQFLFDGFGFWVLLFLFDVWGLWVLLTTKLLLALCSRAFHQPRYLTQPQSVS